MVTRLMQNYRDRTINMAARVGMLRATRNPETDKLLTYQEIADQLGTTRQNVYRYFKMYMEKNNV